MAPMIPSPERGLRVASAQALAVPGEIERNVATAVRLIAEASVGAVLVVLPEFFSAVTT